MKLPFVARVAHKESFPRAVIFINVLHLPRPRLHYDELLKEFIMRGFYATPSLSRWTAAREHAFLSILLQLNNARRRIVLELSLARWWNVSELHEMLLISRNANVNGFLITTASGWKILRDRRVRDANAPARCSLTDEQIVFGYCSR